MKHMELWKLLIMPLLNQRGDIVLGAEIGGAPPEIDSAGTQVTDPADTLDDGGDAGDVGEPTEPVRYTAEELAALPFEKLSELNPALKKNVDRFFSMKGEETKAQLDARLRTLESQAQRQQQNTPFKSVEEYYMADPDRCLADMNAHIGNLRQRIRTEGDPTGELNDAVLSAIDKKAELPRLDVQRQNRNTAVGQVWQNRDAELARAIPDIENTLPQINDYAMQKFAKLGVDMDLIQVMTNPEIGAAVAQITGNPNHARMGTVITLAMAQLYAEANAGKNLKAKQSNTPPRTVEPGMAATTAKNAPKMPPAGAPPEAWAKYMTEKRAYDQKRG